MNLKWTLVLLSLGVVGLFILTAWVEALQKFIFRALQLDTNSASAWLVLAIFSTVLFLLVLQLFGIELHDLIGISETVDEELTDQKEVFKKGKLVHKKL